MNYGKYLPVCLNLLLLSVYFSGLFLHCGRSPTEARRSECGSIQLRAQITENLSKTAATAATSFENIVLEVWGIDMDTLRFSKKINGRPVVVTDTFTGIPAGNRREVKIYTTDKSGFKVHIDSLGNRVVRVDQNALTTINARLIPAAGSLYLQLANVSTYVDSVFLSFVSTGRTWEKRMKRSLKMNMSLDNIPDGTQGTVFFTAINSSGDTVYHASKKLTFNARESSELKFDFDFIPGSIAMNLSLKNTGVTLIAINLGNPEISVETGSLIITEILYYSPDSSEYIEIYNPSNAAITIDTLILEIDNSWKKIESITIAAHGFYILGRKAYAWVDKLLQPSSFLDLSQTGNLITLRAKDSSIIDQVIFIGGNNTLEWPAGESNKAISLDSTSYNVIRNNFGRNWFLVTKKVSVNDSLYGTPHSK